MHRRGTESVVPTGCAPPLQVLRPGFDSNTDGRWAHHSPGPTLTCCLGSRWEGNLFNSLFFFFLLWLPQG